jgi:hypothetical protein
MSNTTSMHFNFSREMGDATSEDKKIDLWEARNKGPTYYHESRLNLES